MMVALIGTSAAIGAAVLHVFIVGQLPLRWRLVSIPAFSLVAYAALYLLISALGWSVSGEDWVVALIIALSLGAAYALVFIGIMFDSATLALINSIEDCGAAGMPIAGLAAFSARHKFVSSRLAALIEDRVLVDDGAALVLRGNIGVLVRVSAAYRRLSGRETISG